MKTLIVKMPILSCIFLFVSGLFFSCTNNERIENEISKTTVDMSQYMTVNEDFQWELNISKSDALKLGISQDEYNQALNNLEQMNEQIEVDKKDANKTVVFCLPDKQISINKGNVEVVKKEKIRTGSFCKTLHTDIWYQHYLAVSARRLSSNQGLAFYTGATQNRLCVQVHIHTECGSSGRQFIIKNDVSKQVWSVFGTSTEYDFTTEMYALPVPDRGRYYWAIFCEIPYTYAGAIFLNIDCYTNTPYLENV